MFESHVGQAFQTLGRAIGGFVRSFTSGPRNYSRCSQTSPDILLFKKRKKKTKKECGGVGGNEPSDNRLAQISEWWTMYLSGQWDKVTRFLILLTFVYGSVIRTRPGCFLSNYMEWRIGFNNQ